MPERDWQTDYDWVNSPDVCITERMQELANYWLLRARGLEEENRKLRAVLISVGTSIAIARNGLAEPPILEHADKYTKLALDEINTALDGEEKKSQTVIVEEDDGYPD